MRLQDREALQEHKQQLENTDVKDGTFMTQQERFSPTPDKHPIDRLAEETYVDPAANLIEPPKEGEVMDQDGNQYTEWKPPSQPASPMKEQPIRVESRVEQEDGWLYNNYKEPEEDEIEDNYGGLDEPTEAKFETERKENTESPYFKN